MNAETIRQTCAEAVGPDWSVTVSPHQSLDQWEIKASRDGVTVDVRWGFLGLRSHDDVRSVAALLRRRTADSARSC